MYERQIQAAYAVHMRWMSPVRPGRRITNIRCEGKAGARTRLGHSDIVVFDWYTLALTAIVVASSVHVRKGPRAGACACGRSLPRLPQTVATFSMRG